MIDVNEYNIADHLRNGLIHVNMVYPQRSDAHFRVDKAIKVTLSNYEEIVIPKKYEFDGSSSPRFLWWLFPSYGDFFFAALIHDYLYTTQYKHEELGIDEARKLADKEMIHWSMIVNNKNIGKVIDNHLRFKAVRLFGKRIYIT